MNSARSRLFGRAHFRIGCGSHVLTTLATAELSLGPGYPRSVARRGGQRATAAGSGDPGGSPDGREGERPGYRLRTAQDDSWIIDALPWVTAHATGARDALNDAQAATRNGMDGPPDTFGLE